VAREKWAKYSKRKITPEDIEEGVRSGNASMAALSDLQKHVLGIARGLFRGDKEIEGALVHAEEVTIETEHHGAIFVQRQIADLLKRMEEKAKASRHKDSEWTVL